MRGVEGANARAIDGGVIAEKHAEPPALTLGADFVLGRRKLVNARKWEHESAERPRLSRATIVGIAGDGVSHVQGRRWKKAGVVDRAGEQCV